MERALCPVLVGREAELSQLEDALLGSNRGEAQVVVLAGDAGMGKTRLATELQRRARRLGMNVMWGGCSEADLALPYLPFLEAIGNFIRGMDLPDLRNKLGVEARELAHLFPQLAAEGVAPDLDSMQGRLRLYEAVLALLELAARDKGLLILLEDLHWSDASTRELLDYLTRRLRGERIMVLATHRSDEMHRRHPLLPMIQGWRRSSVATMVELGPLTADKVAQMVIAIFDLGEEGVQDDTRDFLYERTEGNPFVLEEMLKAALDRGDIFRSKEGWTRKSLEDFELPRSVRETILLRVDRLRPEEIELLRTAAVIGSSFSYETLLSVSERSEAEVRTALEACVLQQLLQEDPRIRAGYRFRHALTREAIYDEIITPVRERWHGLTADALQANGGAPIDIAQHLLAAGRSDEAVPLCLIAAEKAELEYAHADAAALYERILPHLGEEEGQRATVLCRLGAAYWGAAQPSAAYGYLDAGVGLLDRAGDVRGAAHYRLIQGQCAWEIGKSEEAPRHYERARTELEADGPSRDLAYAYVNLARVSLTALDANAVVLQAGKAMTIADSAAAGDIMVHAQTLLGVGQALSGNVDDGLRTLNRGFENAMRLRLHSTALSAATNSTILRCNSYRAAEALDRLELLQQVPESPAKALATSHIEGLASYPLGELPRAALAYEREMSIGRAVGHPRHIIRGRKGLADCLFGMGRDSEASAINPEGQELDGFEDRVWGTMATIRRRLDHNDLAGIEESARLIFEVDPTWESNWRADLASWSMWAFMAAGDNESAQKAAQFGIGDGTNVPKPIREVLEAGLALLSGDLADAIKHLRWSVEFLDGVGYHVYGCALRRRLAGLLLEADDAEGATAELTKVLEVSSRLGMLLERRLVAQELEKLGVAVAEELHTPLSPAIRTGERYVTVLFSDVRNYTAMTRETPPPDLAETVATLQRWAGAEVHKRRGIVDKFAGDAVMATFNVSGAHVDHAQQALACALAIRDKADALGLPMGAGIATGPATVGSFREGANISVLGETTNLASRLQGSASGGEVLLSGETYRRVADWLTAQRYSVESSEIRLKGYDETVRAWRVRDRLNDGE